MTIHNELVVKTITRRMTRMSKNESTPTNNKSEIVKSISSEKLQKETDKIIHSLVTRRALKFRPSENDQDNESQLSLDATEDSESASVVKPKAFLIKSHSLLKPSLCDLKSDSREYKRALDRLIKNETESRISELSLSMQFTKKFQAYNEEKKRRIIANSHKKELL